MKSLFLCLARFCSAAWVGAATLFVVVAVGQITSKQFASEVTDRLAALRFPPFYLFGFTLVGTAFVGTLLGGSLLDCRRRQATAAVSLLVAMGLMTADYFAVYQPLIRMISPPGSQRPPEFERYHQLSEIINTVGMAFVLGASLLLSWPAKRWGAPQPLVELEGKRPVR
jgi:hypothetical protein